MSAPTLLYEQAKAFFAAWHNTAQNCAERVASAAPKHQSTISETAARSSCAIDIGTWHSFFTGWPKPQMYTPSKNHRAPFDCEGFASFAPLFSKAADKLWRNGSAANVWKVTGLGHDELRNSEVLAWFLSKFGEHGQGSKILEIFLAAISAQGSPETRIRPEDVCKGPYWTNTESLPLGEAGSRIDIEIESPHFLLFIEVKIRAPETGDQLERYVDLVKRKAANRRWQVVFLTPEGREARNLALGPHVSSISWKQFGAAIAAHLAKEELGSVPKVLLRQYAEYLQTLS